MRTNRPSIILALCAALAVAPAFAQSAGENEPNIALPAASTHYAADEVPDRIVATPAQDASTGFSVNWRTNAAVSMPLLEIVVAGDSPDVGTPRRVVATTVVPAYRDGGTAHVHRADHFAFPVRQVGDTEDDRHRNDNDLDDRPHHQPPGRTQQGLTMALKNVQPLHQTRSTIN